MRAGLRHPLARFVAARLLQSVVVLAGALVLCFALGALAGDPSGLVNRATVGADPAAIKALREHLGYGDPLPVRFVHFLAGVWRGDFGTSYRTGGSALGEALSALPNTVVLVACSLAVSLALALALAVASVLSRGRAVDRLVARAVALMQGIPDFWLATMLVLVFAVGLGWLPALGFDGPEALILPTTAISVSLLPTFVRLARGGLLDVMRLDFITSLRGKGLSERDIVLRHALRNALPGLVTFTALQIGWLIGGTIIVETIFSWPGIGNLAVDAVQARDLTVVQAIVAVVAVSYIVMNLAADVLVAILDPRIRVVPA